MRAQGDRSNISGIYVHPLIAYDVAGWISPLFKKRMYEIIQAKDEFEKKRELQQKDEYINMILAQLAETRQQLTNDIRVVIQQNEDHKNEIQVVQNQNIEMNGTINEMNGTINEMGETINEICIYGAPAAQIPGTAAKFIIYQLVPEYLSHTIVDGCNYRRFRSQIKRIKKIDKKIKEEFPWATKIFDETIASRINVGIRLYSELKGMNEFIAHERKINTFGVKSLTSDDLVEIIEEIVDFV